MKIQEKKKVHIRWMLVCYDIFIVGNIIAAALRRE